ncbi:serine/threonine protein kinase [Candidatus Obscuribacterales bacterium]|nr:serine/threonine protein kinase [Candidatus Obscuribacterales bacterium]
MVRRKSHLKTINFRRSPPRKPVIVQETQSDNAFPKIRSDRYRILSVLGAGAVGTVYKAHDSTLDKTVAIKKLNRAASDEEAIRFHREAKLAGTLKHPNVLSVLDFGLTEDDEPYLVLNYVQGVNLAERISELGAIPANESLRLFIELVKGLIHAHSKNVIHRDIKPGNVMLLKTDDGVETATLVDFGLAKSICEQQELTKSGVGVGTPMYMSPEQIRGQQVDERTDIYSMGCLMYETLTGIKPFQTDQLLELIEMKLHQLPEAVSELAPYEVPEKLSDIVDKCMEIEREDRFSSASELLQALESVQLLDGANSPNSSSVTTQTGNAQRVMSALKHLNWRIGLIALVGVLSLSLPLLMILLLAPGSEDSKTAHEINRLDKFTKGKTINSFVGMKVDDDDLIALVRAHPGAIDELRLWQPKITSRSLAFFENEKLRDLSFRESREPIDSEIFKAVSKIKSLRILRFTGNDSVSFDSFHLLNSSGVVELEFDDQELAPDAIAQIARAKNIQRMEMERLVGLKGQTMKALYPMKALKELLMSTTDVNDETIKSLAESGVPLRKLVCDLTEIGPASLESALRMPYLNLIAVAHCAHLKKEQVEKFHQTRLHQFQIYWKPDRWMPNSDKSVP